MVDKLSTSLSTSLSTWRKRGQKHGPNEATLSRQAMTRPTPSLKSDSIPSNPKSHVLRWRWEYGRKLVNLRPNGEYSLSEAHK